jgi:hypothetical protein
MKIKWIGINGLLAVALCGSAAGCGGTSPPPPEKVADQQHIVQVVRLWTEYKRDHKNQAPTSGDQLKAWAKKLSADRLSQLSVKDVDTAFVSPRDGQPYGFRSPAKDNALGQGTIVYEQNGVSGKRMVASNIGSVSEIDDAEFQKMSK